MTTPRTFKASNGEQCIIKLPAGPSWYSIGSLRNSEAHPENCKVSMANRRHILNHTQRIDKDIFLRPVPLRPTSYWGPCPCDRLALFEMLRYMEVLLATHPSKQTRCFQYIIYGQVSRPARVFGTSTACKWTPNHSYQQGAHGFGNERCTYVSWKDDKTVYDTVKWYKIIYSPTSMGLANDILM